MLPLPLKLLRSLVLGESIYTNNNILLHSHNHNHDSQQEHHHQKTTKMPLLLFLPTKELVTDTYRLATIARDMGMDLYPTPSLSHIIFSYPSSSSSSSSPSQLSSWSSISLSSSLILPNDAVPLPFPSLSSSSLSHLRSFVSLSKGLFKLVFATVNSDAIDNNKGDNSGSHWNCCSFSLFSRLNGDRINTMEAFSRALAGVGWTLFKTKKNPSMESGRSKSVYLFRKVDSGRVRAGRVGGGCRIRELRLPALDFGNAPLRILQYVVLMTDDVFFIA